MKRKLYPISLNDIILKYLGYEDSMSLWRKDEKRKMIKKLRSFGYILYNNQVITIFGGRCKDFYTKNQTIYYLDLFSNDGWKESKLKCPKPGECHAVNVDDKYVYILPSYDDHKDIFKIQIVDILPSNLIKQNNE